MKRPLREILVTGRFAVAFPRRLPEPADGAMACTFLPEYLPALASLPPFSPGKANESLMPYNRQLKRQLEKFSFHPETK